MFGMRTNIRIVKKIPCSCLSVKPRTASPGAVDMLRKAARSLRKGPKTDAEAWQILAIGTKNPADRSAGWGILDGAGSGSGLQVVAIRVHHLGPGGDEILDELLRVVVLRIDLGIGAQHGVGTEDEIHAARRPLHRARLAIHDVVAVLAGGNPGIRHIREVHEEIRRESTFAGGEDAMLRAAMVGASARMPPTRTVISAAVRSISCARSRSSSSGETV